METAARQRLNLGLNATLCHQLYPVALQTLPKPQLVAAKLNSSTRYSGGGRVAFISGFFLKWPF